MLASQSNNSFSSILDVSEELFRQASGMDADELKIRVSEYNQKIEDHFRLYQSENITEKVQDELKQLISTHEKMITFFSKEKEKLSKNIKQLHAGKEMKNAYL